MAHTRRLLSEADPWVDRKGVDKKTFVPNREQSPGFGGLSHGTELPADMAKGPCVPRRLANVALGGRGSLRSRQPDGLRPPRSLKDARSPGPI
jgi:hypothetical protein